MPLPTITVYPYSTSKMTSTPKVTPKITQAFKEFIKDQIEFVLVVQYLSHIY